MADPAIEMRGVEKRYGEVHALRGLDLCVAQGAFFGLLGPNGAGKTTTVSVLATLARPTAGRARLLGRDVVTQAAAVRGELGLVFQETCLDEDLTAREQLDLHARLYHLAGRRRRVEEVLELVSLDGDADRPVRGYSGGMKRRLEIARGLLHRPRVLFLDEPTLGLDVAARDVVWRHLRSLHAAGATTLFLTTHAMQEADTLCDRVGILDAGRLVAEGEPAALRAGLGGDVVVLDLDRDGGAREALERVEGVAAVAAETQSAGPAQPPSGAAQAASGGVIRLRVTIADGPRRLPALLDAARPFGVIAVRLHRPTLEHVFLHHTGHPFEPERLGAET